MKPKTMFNLLLALGLMLALGAGSSLAQDATVQGETGVQAAVGTAFTYQGRLVKNGSPVAGACDFQFSLWDAASGGTQVGSTLTIASVTPDAGYFSATLDFGDGGLGTATFAGDARYLQIAVRCPAGSGGYTTLSGRVELTAAPYALSLRPGAVVAGDKSGFTVLTARNTTTGEFGAGLKAETNATKGTALIAESKSGSSFQTYGVYATAASGDGIGVYGESKSLSTEMDESAYGGYFKANGGDDVGVYGESASAHGSGVGVQGKTNAPYGSGVAGVAADTSGVNYGVYGETKSTAGYGVYSKGNAHVDGNLTWKAKTGYVAVSAAAFQPVDSGYSYANWGNKLTPLNSSSHYYYAAVQLPHHATVTRLTFAWRDTSSSNAECKLFRNNLAGGGDEMAQAVSSGATGNGGTQDLTIDYASVDNTMYAYYLQWYLPDPNTSGYAVIIEYTITEAY